MHQWIYIPQQKGSIVIFLCLIIRTVFLDAQYLSAIYITPAITAIEEGTSHTLECVVTGDTSTPMFSWFFEEEAIDNTDSRFLLSSGELEIQAFSTGLEGMYRCAAQNSFGKIVSFSLDLKLAYFRVERSSLPSSIPIVSPNSSFALTCPLSAVSSHPPPSVSWWYASTQIQDHYPLVVSLDYELVFSLIRQSDTGVYACRATNLFLNVSEEFDVAAVTSDESLNVIRSFYISPANRTATLGYDVSFQCIITGSSSSQPALWKFGDASLIESNRISLTQSSGILTIRNVTLRDTGSYSCIDADNQLDSRFFTLTVITPPKVVSNQSLYLEPAQGSNLSLSCESVGTPPITYSWYYNGNLVDSPRDFSGEIELRSVSTTDTGLYQCYAENSAGRDMRVFALNVKGFEPQLTFQQRDILAFEGSAFTFGFVAYGAPAPVYTYSLNNHTLQLTDYSKLNETHYSVADAKSAHSGLYTCTISNTAGYIQYSFRILVVYPTEPYSPMVDSVTALLGTSVSLACRAATDTNYNTLTLSYKWERSGVAIDVSSGGRYQIAGSFGDLHISQIESTDAGNYTCIALTADTSLTSESHLETVIGYTDIRIATVPDPPATITALLTGDTSLEVSWSPPANSGGVSISAYIVEYTFVNSVQWRYAGESNILAFNFTTCPSSVYVFRVSALNAVGSSVPSLVSVPIEVPGQVPDVSPANLTLSSDPTPTQLSLAWKVPYSNTTCSGLNGNLSDHFIQYISASQMSPRYAWTGSSELSYTLIDLAPFTVYKIRVAFKNSIGIGELSDHISAETSYNSPLHSPASFELESYGRGRIAVYFTAPRDNGIITGYKVRCESDAGDVLSRFLSNDSVSTLTVMSDGVVDGTSYICYIVAYNAVGDGPPTPTKTVIASERKVPNLPESLSIQPNGLYGASFSWTAPNQTEFLLTLEYHYSLTPQIQRQSVFVLLSPLSTHTVSTLDAGVLYSVKFAGRNTDGIGFNLTSVFELPPGIPRSPTLAVSEAANGDNATLIWNISHNGGSTITKIIVQRKIQDSTWFTVATINNYSTTAYALSIADKGFQFRIVIHNNFGSASSTPVLFESSIERDVSPIIFIVIAIAIATVLALTCILLSCLLVYLSYWRQHRKSRFLDVRGSTDEHSVVEESRIFRNLNNASVDDNKTEKFPAQQSESSSECTDKPPSYHSSYPSKDSKTSTKSSGSSRRKVEITEQKRQGPAKKGVLSQPGKSQSVKLPHKKVVFSEQNGQSSIDSDSTEPSQVSWTNSFNKQLRDSPTPINLEEFTPTLPSRYRADKQPHPLNLTTNSFSNIFPGRNSDVWDFKYEEGAPPAHLISHKKSKSDELSDHYSTVFDVLPNNPAFKKLKGSSGKLTPDVRNKLKARAKSPISFFSQKLSPAKPKEQEASNHKAPIPLPDLPNPAFDESALSNTVFSFDQITSRIPSPAGFDHQHTDSTQSQQASSLSSVC